jgi:hypothetical protein
MTPPQNDRAGAERPILLGAVRSLVAEARTESALLSADSPERQFYLGIQAAAEEVLKPELGMSRGTGWLDHEAVAFREGYAKTRTLLADAMVSKESPLRFPLPHFRPAE